MRPACAASTTNFSYLSSLSIKRPEPGYMANKWVKQNTNPSLHASRQHVDLRSAFQQVRSIGRFWRLRWKFEGCGTAFAAAVSVSFTTIQHIQQTNANCRFVGECHGARESGRRRRPRRCTTLQTTARKCDVRGLRGTPGGRPGRCLPQVGFTRGTRCTAPRSCRWGR